MRTRKTSKKPYMPSTKALKKTPKQYVVEKLLKKRISPIDGQMEYFVKWMGYDDSWNTWEPPHAFVSYFWIVDSLNSKAYNYVCNVVFQDPKFLEEWEDLLELVETKEEEPGEKQQEQQAAINETEDDAEESVDNAYVSLGFYEY